MEQYPRKWQNYTNTDEIRFKCGYCGTDTSPAKGWNTDSYNNNQGSHQGFILICTYCNKPSFVDTQNKKVLSTTPSATFGNKVNGLTEEVNKLYDEARKCSSIGAHTSTVLTCRKILMHVAVEKGAPVGKKFLDYVNYLADNNYIPPDGKEWVDHIRSKSNEANHEINIMEIADAEDLISFTEMLLRLVYEFKFRLKKDSINNSNLKLPDTK
jgi:hypothetical protein